MGRLPQKLNLVSLLSNHQQKQTKKTILRISKKSCSLSIGSFNHFGSLVKLKTTHSGLLQKRFLSSSTFFDPPSFLNSRALLGQGQGNNLFWDYPSISYQEIQKGRSDSRRVIQRQKADGEIPFRTFTTTTTSHPIFSHFLSTSKFSFSYCDFDLKAMNQNPVFPRADSVSGSKNNRDIAYFIRGLHLFISSSVLVSFYINRWKRDKLQKEMALYEILSKTNEKDDGAGDNNHTTNNNNNNNNNGVTIMRRGSGRDSIYDEADNLNGSYISNYKRNNSGSILSIKSTPSHRNFSNSSSHASLTSLLAENSNNTKRKGTNNILSINNITNTLGILGRGVGLGSSVDMRIKRSLTASSRVSLQNLSPSIRREISGNSFNYQDHDDHYTPSSYHNPQQQQLLQQQRQPYQIDFFNSFSKNGNSKNEKQINALQIRRARLEKRLFSTSTTSLKQSNSESVEKLDKGQNDRFKVKKSMVYTRTGDGGSSMLYNGERRSKDDYTFEALGAVDELNANLGVAREYLLLSSYTFASDPDHLNEHHHLYGKENSTSSNGRGDNTDSNHLKSGHDHQDESKISQFDDEHESIEITNDLLERMIQHIQCRLHDMGASIATPPTSSKSTTKKLQYVKFDKRHLPKLEQWIDLLDANVPPLTKFILPSGGLSASQLHVCRTVCRRAERVIVPLNRVARERERMDSEQQEESNESNKLNQNQITTPNDDMIGVDPEVGKYLNRLSDFLFVASRVAAKNDGREECVWVKETFEDSFINTGKKKQLDDNVVVHDEEVLSESSENSESQKIDF